MENAHPNIDHPNTKISKRWIAIFVVAVIIMVVVIIGLKQGWFSGKEPFTQIKVGANSYKVHEDLDNPVKAAETMDRLNTVATTLIDHLQSKYIYGSMDSIKPEFQSIVSDGIKDLKQNFVTAHMEENIPSRSGGDTSFVIDKGSVFAMCLRDPNNGHQLDPKFNDLTFVLIHEMSHLACGDIFGHPFEFWCMFKFLLQETVDIGLYKLVDYKKYGSPYCGITITYTPLLDNSLIDYRK